MKVTQTVTRAKSSACTVMLYILSAAWATASFSDWSRALYLEVIRESKGPCSTCHGLLKDTNLVGTPCSE
jgi:hypothetical protein